MKLYATLETSRGKQVSISDNEQIIATVYDGNMKAYSVIIGICNIGNTDMWECRNCKHEERWTNYGDGTPICPTCDNDMEQRAPEVGTIVTTQEWRNRPKINDKQKLQRTA